MALAFRPGFTEVNYPELVVAAGPNVVKRHNCGNAFTQNFGEYGWNDRRVILP